MKTKSTFNKFFIKTLIVVSFITSSFAVVAQNEDQPNLRDFKIVIENMENGLKIQSLKGCAWVDLSFGQSNDLPQYIDEYGMTEKDNVSAIKDANIADFLIIVTKTKDGINLKGLEGTAWTELNFSISNNGKQTIDQFGMSE